MARKISKGRRKGGYLSEWADRQLRGAFNDVYGSTKSGANPEQPDVSSIMQ